MKANLKLTWIAVLAASSAIWSISLLAPRQTKADGCASGECEAAGLCYSDGSCLENGQLCDNGAWLSVRQSEQFCPVD